MRSKLSIPLLILFFAGILNLTAQATSLKVFVYDANMDNPIENALVTILWNGNGIDSAYTDINGIASIDIPITSVRNVEGLPSSISLSNNYPNPFNDNTNVEMSVPEPQSITASVYNILGQRVASEQIRVYGGNYTLNLSLGHLPNGVYFLRVGGGESQAVKLTKLGNNIQYSGSLFSVSPSSLPVSGSISKSTDEVYTLRAHKEEYYLYETSITGAANGEIAIPLTPNSENETGTVTDIDGNVYQTVSMGMMDEKGKITYREWLAENLRVTHYRNGDEIFYSPPWVRSTSYGLPPAHQTLHHKYHIDQGFPGTYEHDSDPFTAIHWKDENRIYFAEEDHEDFTGTGLDLEIIDHELSEGKTYQEAVLIALEDMVNREGDAITTIDPAMHWHLLGVEGIAIYKDGMFLKDGANYNTDYGTFGARTNLTPAFYDDRIETHEDVIKYYGFTYNWYAVSDPRGLCPEGWHVPSEEEWREMERYIINEATNGQLTLAEIETIMSSSAYGGEYEEHNINLGGRLKSQNSMSMEIGMVDGDQGNNYVIINSSRDEQKISAHLEEGDVIRLAMHSLNPGGSGDYAGTNVSEEFTVESIDLPNGRIYLDGDLDRNWHLDEENVYLLLISKNEEEVVSSDHPIWGNPLYYSQGLYGRSNYMNIGNSDFAGGGSSGLNLVSVGFLQIPGRAFGWYPEQQFSYTTFNTMFWTSTGYDEQNNPLIYTEISPEVDPLPYPGDYAALARRIMARSSGVINRLFLRSDGAAVRCVKF